MPDRYEEMGYWEIITRQMSIISKNRQNIFKNSKIAVIGCGGIGGAAIEMLARMGVGTLNIVDCDYFDVSNINRQTMSNFNTINKSKSEITKEKINQINPYVKVNAFNDIITEESIELIASDCDIIIDALDNIYTRIIVARFAKKNNIDFVHGAIHGTLGQLTVFSENTIEYEELFSFNSFNKKLTKDVKKELEKLSADVPPVIGPTPNIIGILQAMEAFKIITGLGEITLAPKILKFDLLYFDSFTVEEI